MSKRSSCLIVGIVLVLIAGLFVLAILAGILFADRNKVVLNSCEPYGSLHYSVCGEETGYCPYEIRVDYRLKFEGDQAFINGIAVSEGYVLGKDGMILATVTRIRKPKITLELSDNVVHTSYRYKVIPRGE